MQEGWWIVRIGKSRQETKGTGNKGRGLVGMEERFAIWKIDFKSAKEWQVRFCLGVSTFPKVFEAYPGMRGYKLSGKMESRRPVS